MKQVIIKSMKLTNFKGLRDFSIEFNSSSTTILAKNGAGKTTIFDAFTWLLFGKDSLDRKDFNIKTFNAKGITIPRIPHEVSAVLSVDGEEVNLCHRFNEKWQKKRGSAIEEFKGHEEERLYNDVPCSVKEWNEKIANICSEQVFKFITNPRYFSAQKADVQRAMIFRMIGDVSNDDIAAGNEDFTALLTNLTGKTMEEYKREISAKKRRIKTEIAGIPDRIDERKRDMPESENWLLLDADLSNKQKELLETEQAITDSSQAYKTASDERLALQKKLSNLQLDRQTRESNIITSVQKEYNEQVIQQSKLKDELKKAENELASARAEQQGYKEDLESQKAKRETLISEWRKIKAHTLVFNEDEFVCPTCKRPLDIDDIERKRNELTENFNSKQADDLAENNRKGQQVKKKITEIDALINKCDERISMLESRIRDIKSDTLYTKSLVAPDAVPAIAADAEIKKLDAEIKKLDAEVNTPIVAADTSELTAKKKMLTSDIDTIKEKLSKRDTIERNEMRIKELERQLTEQNEELTKLEGIELTMQAFSKARTEAVESRINGLFSIVKFKMFEQQVNGEEVETCEATVDGVPYSDLNHASKINAGLDIINAICKYEDMSAPIFIDNAESVTDFLPTQSQMIKLTVSSNVKGIYIEYV